MVWRATQGKGSHCKSNIKCNIKLHRSWWRKTHRTFLNLVLGSDKTKTGLPHYDVRCYKEIGEGLQAWEHKYDCKVQECSFVFWGLWHSDSGTESQCSWGAITEPLSRLIQNVWSSKKKKTKQKATYSWFHLILLEKIFFIFYIINFARTSNSEYEGMICTCKLKMTEINRHKNIMV